MKKKTVILIDGQNLYYSLQEMKVMEKDVDWTKLFSDLVEPEDEFVRAYWFRPAKILDTYYTPDNIQRTIVYKEYRTHCENYRTGNLSIVPQPVRDAVKAKCDAVSDWLKKQKDKFANLEYAYDQLCLRHDNIEMVKNGVVKVDPYKQIYVGEKGVDISLAVKMIALSVDKKCDKIILVSGDYDYAEAIRYVKNNMTKINVVKLHKGYPPRNRSMSRDLSVLADRVIDVYESDIKGKYKQV